MFSCCARQGKYILGLGNWRVIRYTVVFFIILINSDLHLSGLYSVTRTSRYVTPLQINSWHAEIILWNIGTLYFLPYFQWNATSRWTPSPWMTNIHASCIWVRSRDCGCLVTWFCYQLIAKPDNKTAAVPWPDRPYSISWLLMAWRHKEKNLYPIIFDSNELPIHALTPIAKPPFSLVYGILIESHNTMEYI